VQGRDAISPLFSARSDLGRVLRCYPVTALLAIKRRRIRTPLPLISTFFFVAANCFPTGAPNSPPKASTAPWTIRANPTRPVNGSPILLQVRPPVPLQSLSGSWLDHKVFFSFDSRSKTWYGIAGASLETKPGRYLLLLTGMTESGKEILAQRKLFVGKGKYRRVALSVPRQFTQPSPGEIQRIDQEKTLKGEIFARISPDRFWSGRFLAPVSTMVSDVFGTTRTFNHKTESVHQGLDYAVPQGTPVSALNSGKVLLARPLFFEGNCVILDHGQGLLTLYMHLSAFEVKEGDMVRRGQKLGLSGGTGRATGPHLHIAVRWQGIYLNPATLLSLELP
jgi:murein DD-endopeptidase MepM/ murein hydrolase activator NlpD